jgi:signal transduction histidine kinase
MDFTLRVVELLAAGFLNLLLAGFIFWKYRRRPVARVFALSTFADAGYCWFLSGAAGAQSADVANLWYRFLMPASYLLLASVFHFCMVFSSTDNRMARAYMRFAYGFAALLSLLRFFNLDQGNMEFHAGQGWFPAGTAYAYVYVPFVYVTVLYGLGLIIRGMIRTKLPSQRNQLWFFFLAIGVGMIFDTFNIVPSLAFLAPLSAVAYSGILSYAITRHRLLDLSLVVKKGALAAGLAFFAAVLIVAAVLKVQDVVIIRGAGFGAFAIFSSALIVSVVLILVWPALYDGVNRLLRIRSLSLEQQLLDYSTLLAKHVRFEEYIAAVLQKVDADMGLTKSWVLLKDRVSGSFSSGRAGLDRELDFGPEHPLVQSLNEKGPFIDIEEILSMGAGYDGGGDGGRRLSGAMEEVGAALAVPIRGDGKLEGILVLGGKASSAIFSSRELSFAQALAMQIASALENWRLHSQVQQAERLSTLGTLSASLAHELRNPLTSISTFVQMLPARHADEAFREKFGRIVGQEIAKLTRLTEQLLNFSRPASSVHGAVNLWQLCDRTRQLLRYQFSRKNVALQLAGDEAGPWIMGNEAELSQVLINLLLNALQATERGGSVAVEASQQGSRIFLRISDTGSGMTPEQVRHIFEPFYTTKEGGTGLGLPTCQRIIEQHGGAIEVTSSTGNGSVFTINFPVSKVLQASEPAAA